MTLNWNEIRERATKFSKEWQNTQNEAADAKPFLVEFFNVFGINSKKFATFEHRVKKLDDRDGYIDLLWKGTILIEMKSRGKNLDKAFVQAKEYLHGLKQHELPKYILVSDFENFILHDLEEENTVNFKLNDFANQVQNFGYLLGYQKKVYKEQDPANIKAAELMGKLHDRLKEIGYEGHPLEVYLVRLLFCLFAEDTTIFQKQQLQDFITYRTNEDGSDLAPKLQELFQVLNTPPDKRFKNLDEDLLAFPYVNGKLFEEILPMASFDSKMRTSLLECCYLDWSKISPAIFGSMFQSVMNPKERRNLGAHYTSESNILKLIKPLFLDALWAEFETIKSNKNKLPEFHKKISELKFLDPACGCGNFLVITYRELRLLEIEILRATYKNQTATSIENILWLDVDMMSGIEYEEFPARIAEVAMWLIDHQMNMIISNEFGQYFARLPLKKAANIVYGDALKLDWQSLLNKENTIDVYAEHTNIYLVQEPEAVFGSANIQTKTFEVHQTSKPNHQKEIKFDYIIGNPPFIGSRIMNKIQKESLLNVFDNSKNTGELDYVTGWYIKAAKYIQNTKIKVAFVSTNSIVQGEQTAILWGQMCNKYGIKIHFAHRTFKWSNEAKGNAAVNCIIVGFANFDTDNKLIFDYENIIGEAHQLTAKNINAYLLDAKDLLIDKRTNPICNVPKMSFGNMPLDGGNLLFSDEEKEYFLIKQPEAAKYIKPLISAYEFLNGKKRWCLWLIDAPSDEIKKLKEIQKRVEAVKKFRLQSVRTSTNKRAEQPQFFGEIRDFGENCIVIPSTSSENREYIPLGFFDKNSIISNSCHAIPDGTLFHFGILMSKMHMAWVKKVCGRLENRFRYSKDIVYNNFPWPENPTEKQIKSIEEKAQNVLDARSHFSYGLADIYDPLFMPPILRKAHNELDKAVDLAYRSIAFTNDANRTLFLFDLYEKYTADLFTKEKIKRKKTNSK
jgi:hypothetical protein